MPMSICPKCPDDIVNTSDGDTLSEYSTLPSLAINYAENVSHLTNLDVDLNMPADINFSCYTLHDFHSNPDIFDCLLSNNAFSILHSNIRSFRCLIRLLCISSHCHNQTFLNQA